MGRKRHGRRGDAWETPAWLVQEMAAEFGPFDLDACADAQTAKAPRYYTIALDALSRPWGGLVWLNPPYNRNLGEWLKKARAEAAAGATVVCLLPVWTDRDWWHTEVWGKAEVRFLRRRVHFSGAGQPRFASCIVIYRP